VAACRPRGAIKNDFADPPDWPAQKNGARWDSVPHPVVTRVYLFGVGHIRAHRHRPVRGFVKTISVKRGGPRWFVILSCDEVPAQPLPATGAAVGLDMGVASFLTTSDGVHVPNPCLLAAASTRIVAAQRALARKERGGGRRRKAVARIAALHRKVRRIRLARAHKTALALVSDHDVICRKWLKVANMRLRPQPRLAADGIYELNGAAAKAGLSKGILDAGWGLFLWVLAAKAESAGRAVIAVNPSHLADVLPVRTRRRRKPCNRGSIPMSDVQL
jgi:putative transposase